MPKIEQSKSVTSGPKGGARSAAPTGKRTTKTAAPASTRSGRATTDLQEIIRRRAYELWESEGRPEGREQAHWQQAERELAKTRGPRLAAAER